ncbi:Hpt domain-containing protein [Galbibacter mesophilus]|uniref:Hpt domain-containing protein n=1 Tax=Galbibacter mesophilus TaxID=379069 RepID=UPI00191E8CE7|nr:Hpt domain-containing protein [Galbibacter mesophilus]MCM5663714.1 Hpt domain-containing protein [Galbibacter mesophilus]
MKYDLSKLNELSGGDEEFNTSVIETFLLETPEDLSNLKNAVSNQEFTHIYQFAHKIKPNADLLGIDSVRDEMLTIEGHARGDQDMDAIKNLLDSAEKELQESFKLFKAHIS